MLWYFNNLYRCLYSFRSQRAGLKVGFFFYSFCFVFIYLLFILHKVQKKISACAVYTAISAESYPLLQLPSFRAAPDFARMFRNVLAESLADHLEVVSHLEVR